MLLADLVHGRDNPWLTLFDATRADVMASARKVIEENANVAKRFLGDRLRSLRAPSLDTLAPGEGGVVRDGEERVAAYRDESGNVFACSPICTHMGCYLQWNAAEKSWDCPCHGSRFDYRGSVLQGPAVHDLERKRGS
jgi:Rieske Fe-S protein